MVVIEADEAGGQSAGAHGSSTVTGETAPSRAA
jgi:hypothetical protein